MALTGLKNDGLKLILFGGKGGVGKTTCAVSTGLYLAQHFKTLIISTDPAHSLSDSFGLKIGDEIRPVPLTSASPAGRPSSLPQGEKRAGKEGPGINGSLSGLEISAEKTLRKFKAEYQGQIKKILDTSTYLDQEDIDAIFALPIPGIDEVMGFKSILDLIEQGQFDKYVIDTAPTGHALRLLTLPELLDEWIKVMARMRWKYRYMVEVFSGSYNPDEGDRFLVDMKKTVKGIEELLRDPTRCEFIAVTCPEDMAILETERLIDNLAQHKIKVRQLVINNVLESGDCRFCRERKAQQEKYISQIRKRFSNLKTTALPLQPQEVKGIDVLRKFKEFLF